MTVQSEAPGQKPWQKNFTIFMIVASVLGNGFLGFQVIKTYSQQDTTGLSIYSYLALIIGYIFWIIYAGAVTQKPDLPIIVGSAVGLALAVAVIIGISMYGEDIWSLT